MAREPKVRESEADAPRSKHKARKKLARKPVSAPVHKASVSTPVLRQPAASPQVRRVTIRNRRGWLLTPSILDENGKHVTIKLPAYGREEVVEDRITDYTRDLVAQGHLSIDQPR